MKTSTPRSIVRAATLLAAAVLAAGSTAVATAQGPEPAANEVVVRVGPGDSSLEIVERFAKVVRLDDRINRVDGFDPEVVEVKPLDARSIRVLALAPGVTTLTLTDENDDVASVRVFVGGDVRHLQEYISRLFPDTSVEAVEINDAVLLRGWVTQPAQITQIVQVAERFYATVIDQMNVGSVQQVMLKVKVMEVQRSKLQKLGVNLLLAGTRASLGTSVGAITALNSVGGGTVSGDFDGDAVQLALSSIDVFGLSEFDALVEALKEEQLLKILAEPNLVTTNGRPANLLAGGEFPILVPSGLGQVGIEFREFGVRLETVPIVLGHDRVRIQLQAEVSDRDFTNSVVVSGTAVPALTTRRANTQVELGFGESLMIAGLISNIHTATNSKVPYLGDLPWIGSLFSRKSYDEGETELVIVITPELVGPMRPGQVPAIGPGMNTEAPTSRELYKYNMIEVPSYGGPYDDYGRDPGGIASDPGLSTPPRPFARPFSTGGPPLTEYRTVPSQAVPSMPTFAPSTPPAPIEVESLPPVVVPP
ncbi:MAG: type II and III secretion system protein family protein, partial [Planctomycetota bacterium]